MALTQEQENQGNPLIFTITEIIKATEIAKIQINSMELIPALQVPDSKEIARILTTKNHLSRDKKLKQLINIQAGIMSSI